jgi:alkanesulfonate monooxygenase SsuD/methylene tetrahydromethanopterin reductase-like flavin-dependent oxidoreductase (luciferase family)
MVGTFGVDFRAPLGHLSEYLHILKALLREGSVDFQGDYYKAHASIAAPIDVPVMASALGPKAFELCGAESDGAISWVCPATYLRDVALPSMKAGADRAGRPVPPLIAHAPVCVHDNVDEVRAAIREQVPNPRLPFYQHMFAAAGYPEASNGTWSDAMIDGTALVGNESQVADKVEGLLALGATEVLASPIPAGADRAASLERTLQLLAQVSKA